MEALTAAAVAALDGLRHDEGRRPGARDRGGSARREDEARGRVKSGAVLTVSDGVSAGVREDCERRRARGAARGGRLCRHPPGRAGRARRDRRRAARARGRLRRRADDGRHRHGPARRDARGDHVRARPTRRPGLPRRSAPTRSRRRRTACSRVARPASSARTLVVNLPGSPGGCRDGFAVLRPALAHAVALLADEETAHRQT